MSIHGERRKFLRTAVAVGVATTLAATGVANAVGVSSATPSKPSAGQVQYFGVKVTSNLHEAPALAQLLPGKMSDPLELSGNVSYRLRVSTTDRVSKFGPMYNVELFDVNGKPLDSMFAGSTATFQRFGVQVALFPMIQSPVAQAPADR